MSPAHPSARRFLSVLLIGLCLMAVCAPLLTSCFILPASAEAAPAPESADIAVALLCNLENDITLYEKSADRTVYPSSSVKIMTGLLACRALADRQSETVTVTAAMVDGVTGRKMHLCDGEVLTVRDLLYAAICGGYNDAACVLACLTSGSVAAFVGEMNREAQRLGTIHTRYTNPTGLHDPAMATSARDIALIAREAYANNLYMTISSTRTYTIPATNASEERFFSNRNALISDSSRNYYNGYCQGMNAGMTDEGGWCVVTVCERGGASNLCIVLGGADAPSGELIPAYTYTNRLLSWANTAYTYRTVLKAGEVMDTVRVAMTGVSKSKADLTVARDLRVYLPADITAEEALTYQVILPEDGLEAPLSAGDIVGTVTVSYDGYIVGRASLAVTEDFARNGFLDGMMAFRTYLTSRAFLLAIPIFLVLLVPFLYTTGVSHGRYGLRTTRRRRHIRYTKRRL